MSANNVALPAFSVGVPCLGSTAADRRPTGRAAIDQYILAAGLTAADPQWWYAVARWDRWTDRQTDGRTDT